MPTSLAPTTPTPIDPHERRAEWRFAVLVLALVAAQAADAEDRPLRRAASGALVKVGDVKRTGRLVRPPRSC
jgi:poly(3-hydroxybutyrate) depolymerase